MEEQMIEARLRAKEEAWKFVQECIDDLRHIRSTTTHNTSYLAGPITALAQLIDALDE
jgi:hypothetical protein